VDYFNNHFYILELKEDILEIDKLLIFNLKKYKNKLILKNIKSINFTLRIFNKYSKQIDN